MSIIKLTIVKNFESLDMAACYSSIKQHKLKSGAEGEEEIGDSQEPHKQRYKKGTDNSRRPGGTILLRDDVYRIIQGGRSFGRGPIV